MSDFNCQVLIDGVEVADTAHEFEAGHPTVLAGLTHTWGRDSVVDQPATGTLACTVATRADADGAAMFDWISVGKTITVLSGASLPAVGDPVDVCVDGSFEGDVTERTTQTSQYQTWVAAGPPRTGVQSIQMGYSTYQHGTAEFVRIGPAPYDTSWDAIPPLLADVGVWRIKFWAQKHNPHYQRDLAWYPIWMSGPDEPAAWGALRGTPMEWIIQSGGWVTQVDYAVEYIPPGLPRPCWLGIAIIPKGTQWTWSLAGAQPGLTWDDLDPAMTWANMEMIDIDDLEILAPPTARVISLVFSGRITDLELSHGTAFGGGAELTITASDPSAELANEDISDTPWVAQGITARIDRIIYILGVAANPVKPPPFVYYFPAGSNYVVTWVDYDRTAAWSILQDLAASADLVLWPGFDLVEGFGLFFEDVLTRDSVGGLIWDGAQVIIDYGTRYRPAEGITLSACDLADDVTFAQTVADVVTRVDGTWQEQTTDGSGNPAPTERYVHRKDTALEPIHGVRRVSYSTQLTTAADCQLVCDRVLARSNQLNWTVSGVQWDTNYPTNWSEDHTLFESRLLDGKLRMGLAVQITDLPPWAPAEQDSAGYYLEGGTYTYEGRRWRFELNLSPSGAAASSVAWSDIAAEPWTWDQVAASIAWADLYGVDYDPGTWARLTANIVDRT